MSDFNAENVPKFDFRQSCASDPAERSLQMPWLYLGVYF